MLSLNPVNSGPLSKSGKESCPKLNRRWRALVFPTNYTQIIALKLSLSRLKGGRIKKLRIVVIRLRRSGQHFDLWNILVIGCDSY